MWFLKLLFNQNGYITKDIPNIVPNTKLSYDAAIMPNKNKHNTAIKQPMKIVPFIIINLKIFIILDIIN